MAVSKPYNPQCAYWQWVIDHTTGVKVSRCNHKDNKSGECIKGKCPKGDADV